VSLSFDPTHDTPAMLRAYAGQYLKDAAGPRWYCDAAGCDARLRRAGGVDAQKVRATRSSIDALDHG